MNKKNYTLTKKESQVSIVSAHPVTCVAISQRYAYLPTSSYSGPVVLIIVHKSLTIVYLLK